MSNLFEIAKNLPSKNEFSPLKEHRETIILLKKIKKISNAEIANFLNENCPSLKTSATKIGYYLNKKHPISDKETNEVKKKAAQN